MNLNNNAATPKINHCILSVVSKIHKPLQYQNTSLQKCQHIPKAPPTATKTANAARHPIQQQQTGLKSSWAKVSQTTS